MHVQTIIANSINPNNPDIEWNLGVAYYKQGKCSKATPLPRLKNTNLKTRPKPPEIESVSASSMQAPGKPRSKIGVGVAEAAKCDSLGLSPNLTLGLAELR
jgi:hypothetical protein